MSLEPTYTYTPLRDPSREIRILKLKSARDNSQPLAGTLKVHKLPSLDADGNARASNLFRLPVYQALSYVWGSGSNLIRSHEIIVDGKRLPITSNLHAALHTGRNFASMRFWIDAICINQADNDERSTQVLLMRDIFHMAMAVCVWLGPHTPDRDRAITFLGNLTGKETGTVAKVSDKLNSVKTFDSVGERIKWYRRNVLRSGLERLYLKGLIKGVLNLLRWMLVGIDVVTRLWYGPEKAVTRRAVFYDLEELKSWTPTEEQLKAVAGTDFQEMATIIDRVLFSETEYFNRMWTLQELVVSDRGGVFILGISITDLAPIILYLKRTYKISTHGIEKITTLIDAIVGFVQNIKQSLRSLFALSAGRTAHDPRDRIYGIQGLMKDELNPLLRPQYTKPVIEVYTNTARHIIFTEQSLDVLCGHPLGDRFLELPSWVPNFRNYGLNKGAMLTEEWKTLQVAGICLGAVSELSDVTKLDDKSQTERFAQIEPSWANLLRQSQGWTSEELEAIGRVSDLVAKYAEYYQDSDRATFGARNEEKLQAIQAITKDTNNQSESVLEVQFKYFCTLLCGRIAPETRCNEKNLPGHMTQVCTPDDDGIAALKAFCKSLKTGTRGRRLIVSEDKHMGAAPEKTQTGDVIYILMGCSVPVILRKSKTDGEFKFIGECYMHGFMDGEALATGGGKKAITEEFKLV